MAEFLKAIDGLIDREVSSFKNGGYTNDPSDKGGETKWGISKRSYPHLDIAGLTIQDAIDIYCEDYWVPLCADQIVKQVVANVLFDFAVNTGRRRAIKLMQQIACVSIDGMIGPITIGAINSADGEKLAMQYTLQRVQFYSDLASGRKSQRKFLSGWINRALSALYD